MYAAVIGSELIGKIISSVFWGRCSDKIGNITILTLVSVLMPAVPLLWMLSPNVIYLMLVQLLSGIIWAGFDISTWSWMHKTIPPDRKPRYLTYIFSLNSFSKAAGALIGILLLGLNMEFLGSSILSLFFISGILRLIVAVYALPSLRNMSEPAEQFVYENHNHIEADATHKTDTGNHKDLLYRPQSLAGYGRGSVMQASPPGRSKDSAGQKGGLFYRPQE